MAVMRIKGHKPATRVNITAQVGADSGSVDVAAFRTPPKIASLPLVSSGQQDGDTLTLDVSGLTGVSAYLWREVGGATLGTSATLDSTGHAGKWVECQVTCNEGVLLSPAVMIYMVGMMVEQGIDDAAVLALMPHSDATHIAVADGNWTDPATWLDGRVPANGARYLIPHGIAVTYDNTTDHIRMDVGRVDGSFSLELAENTNYKVLIETLIGTRGSSMVFGTAQNRIPVTSRCDIVFSGRNYRDNTLTPTDLDFSRDPRLWGRGLIAQGEWSFWGAEKQTWSEADPMEAGATSATLHKVPTGWAIGDTIVITGTAIDYTPPDAGMSAPMIYQDEERVITGISGNTVSWSGGLTHPHKNQAARSSRTDLYPAVALKGGFNLSHRSEVTSPVWQRGHSAWMHHPCTVDGWSGEFIDMGRTDKAYMAGVIEPTDDTLMRYYNGLEITNPDGSTDADIQFAPLTPQSNIQSRYSLHLHHVGFGHAEDARPIIQGCYVEGVPGWGVVHHACDADIHNTVINGFWGAGMVGESGNELGAWEDNLAFNSTTTQPSLHTTPKTRWGSGGRSGDLFRHGYSFAQRGREIRATGNYAASCAVGHVFFHRIWGDPNDAVVNPIDPKREHVDIGKAGLLTEFRTTADHSEFGFVNYPILHFADNKSVACLQGMFVSKASSLQFHDVNIKLKRFHSWGCKYYGAEVEYVGTYILDRFTVIGSKDGVGTGIILGVNTTQVGTVNCTTEGWSVGIHREWGNTLGTPNGVGHDLFTLDDPRWFEVGHVFRNCPVRSAMFNQDTDLSVKTDAQVTYIDPDYDGTAIDYSANPSDTFPQELGQWDVAQEYGNNFSLYAYTTNADGKKVDNIGALGNLHPKLWDDICFETANYQVRHYCDDFGYYEHDGGWAVVQEEILSDRLTGRPAMVTKTYRCVNSSGVDTEPVRGETNNGPLVYPAAVTQSDMTAAVALNGSVVVNPTTGATGGNGTFDLFAGETYDNNLKPDHGRAVLDATTKTVTYTPDHGYVGTDEMYVFIRSGRRFETVRIDFLVNDGSEGSLTTPVVSTHFTVAADEAANTIGVTLTAQPDTHARRIDLVEYSTDAGSTWRRLCHGWVTDTHSVMTESDGTTIGSGSYDVRIRYKTDYDFATSSASSDVTVTQTLTSTPVVIIAGQSNAGSLNSEGVLAASLAGLRSDTVLRDVYQGGTALTPSDAPWNVTTGDGHDAPGVMYVAFTDEVDQIRLDIPDAYIAGVIWVQGESDAYSITPYYSRAVDLFTKMHTDTGETFPVIISSLNTFQGDELTQVAHVRSEQALLATNLSYASLIDTDDVAASNGLTLKTDVLVDDLHYTAGFRDLVIDEIVRDQALLTSLGV